MKYPPLSLQDFALKVGNGFYCDLSAGAAVADSNIQICIARSQSTSMREGTQMKYGKKVSETALRSIAIANCSGIFEKGVSLLKGVHAWNGTEAPYGQQVEIDDRVGYRLSINALRTDEFDDAMFVVQQLQSIGGACSSVTIWEPE